MGSKVSTESSHITFGGFVTSVYFYEKKRKRSKKKRKYNIK
jgi:hypothetical protein